MYNSNYTVLDCLMLCRLAMVVITIADICWAHSNGTIKRVFVGYVYLITF